MSFITKLKAITKSNWTFATLVLFPIVRLIWRAVVGKSGTAASSSTKAPTGETYKRGDVIDIEAKK